MTASADIQALFQHGKRVDRPSLIVLWQPWDGPRRAGFAVSRQVRGAVGRNRARRRLREAYRAERSQAPVDVRMMVIAKAPVLEMPLARIREEMRQALSAIPGTRTPR